MWGIPKQACLFILFCALTSLFPAALQGNERKAFLVFSGNLVTAELRDAPLNLVLNELKEKKGLKVQGEEKVKEATVSGSFHEVPLATTLARILSRFNYSIIYDRHDRLVGIFIAGKVGHRQTGSSTQRSIRGFLPRRRGTLPN
jgi:type II secretory pathway component GspD/PulD (secretin)